MESSIVFFNGKYLKKEDVRISPEDRGFLFGDGVYEVIKSYNGKLFEADAHLYRLKKSLKSLFIQFHDMDKIHPAAQHLLKENRLSDVPASVYLQITRGQARRTHAFPEKMAVPSFYMMVNPCAVYEKEQKEGVNIIFQPDIRWARCDIKSVALVPNVLASQQAVEQNAFEAVFIRDGAVTEGASSNFLAVINSEIYTYPQSHYILSGITRKFVLSLCQETGIRVNESPVFESQLDEAEEMMLTSTTDEVIPVVRYGGKKVGHGIPGPITRKLQQAFKEKVALL